MTESPTGTRIYWDLVAVELASRGVRRVFGLPGDDMQALTALTVAGVEVVLCRSQRSAAFMALGHGTVTGTPGLVLVGRGPGFAGLVPALPEAAAGGTGLLVLAGGAPLGANRQAFQHLEQTSLVAPIATLTRRMETPDGVRAAVAESLDRVDVCGGAVAYVEIPDDGPASVPPTRSRPDPTGLATPKRFRADSAQVPDPTATPRLLRQARHPIVLVGGGCRRIDSRLVAELAERFAAPVLFTASGRGVVSETHPRLLGCAGLYLHPAAQRLLQDADVLISLGSRLEETAVEQMPSDLDVVQVNIDPAGFSYAHPGVLVNADIAQAIPSWAPEHTPDHDWLKRTLEVRREVEHWAHGVIATNDLAALVNGAVATLPPGSVLCQENGLMDIWSYLFPVTRVPDGVITVTPSEQTTLGFGCAAALGASHAEGAGPVLVITGDGAYATITDELNGHCAHSRGIVYLVLDNGGFGWLEEQNRLAGGRSGLFARVEEVEEDALAAIEAVQEAVRSVRPGSVRTVVVPCPRRSAPPVTSASW